MTETTKSKKQSAVLTVPNIISIARLVLSPVFLYFILTRKPREAFIIFIIAISTDFFDGAVARIFNQRSNLGALLDPMGDKILMTLAFISLSIPSVNHPNVIPLWLTAGVIARDLYIVLGAFAAFKVTGRKKFPPTVTGKISTAFQMSIPLFVLLFNMMDTKSDLLLPLSILTFVMTVVSGIHYTYLGIRWLSESKSRGKI